MKLAEALNKRADLVKEISSISSRLNFNSKVQEGDTPSENIDELLTILDIKIDELEDIITKINFTNHTTIIDGSTLASMISKRDALVKKIDILHNLCNVASTRTDRYSNKEIKVISTVNVALIRKNIDELSKELRLTENKIQESNWTIDLIE